jgi:hypothetical protein
MSGSLFLSAAAFFCVQDVILSYPADLRYPFLWGTVAALFALLLPIIFAEVFVFTLAANRRRIKTLEKVCEMMCWLGGMCGFVIPSVFCVMQDVGHIAIILFQVTAASIFVLAALCVRICRQSNKMALLTVQN